MESLYYENCILISGKDYCIRWNDVDLSFNCYGLGDEIFVCVFLWDLIRMVW